MTGRGGWTQRRVSTTDDSIGVSVHTLAGAKDGPRVLVLGGVHGNEIGGIVAAGMLTTTVPELAAGTLQVVPVAHEAAHGTFTRTGPADDGNLARSFPGRAGGTPTERLAAMIGDRLISDSDVLLDLHTSSPEADMPFFAGCLDDGSTAATRATELAVAFGAGVVWTHPSLGAGRTLTLAQQLGIPALYVESPRGGVLDCEFLDGYVVGVQRVLAALDMLVDDVAPAPPPELWLHGEGDTDAFAASPVDGWFVGDVGLLDTVVEGRRLGRVIDRYGRCRHEVVAGCAGVIVTLRTAANVVVGTPLVGLAATRPAALGFASDRLVQHRGASR